MFGLKDRFEAFIKTLDGYESIDALLRGRDPHGKKRADYLLDGRKVLVEQKSLEVDPVEKPGKFFNELTSEGQFALVGGQVSAEYIFSQLPDGQNLKRELVLKLTRAIEAAVAKADKQTADTRDIFSVPDATGVIVILNESARILTPDIIRYGLAHVFQKTLNGSLRYPHNNGIILISEAHTAHSTSPGIFFPIMTFTSPHGRGEKAVQQFSANLMEHWAKFNGARLLRVR